MIQGLHLVLHRLFLGFSQVIPFKYLGQEMLEYRFEVKREILTER